MAFDTQEIRPLCHLGGRAEANGIIDIESSREGSMKKKIAIIMLVAIIAAPLNAISNAVPSSHRSREARQRVKPILQAQLKAKGFEWGASLFIRIFKDTKTLEVWLHDGRGFRPFKDYTVCTYGWKGAGPKIAKGDGRAPEGFYFVTPSQMNPFSRFHLAFNLGYPNAYDRSHGRTGGALMVHGECVSIGCFAMTNAGIEEIYTLAGAALRYGQPFFRIHIFPFAMTAKNMARYGNSQWIDFWWNLKQGYDSFEKDHCPPNVSVQNGKYHFLSNKN